MNYCTKCASYYQKPGTCNCFAESQPATLAPWPPTITPTWVPYPYTPPYPWTLTITSTGQHGNAAPADFNTAINTMLRDSAQRVAG